MGLRYFSIFRIEKNITGKSLKKFKELFTDRVKLRIRFSLENLKLDGDLLNIPLFMADQTDRLIGLALKQYLLPTGESEPNIKYHGGEELQ